jgi:hypothetical protein
MRMLAEPIPLEEARAMARRLVEPVWKVVAEQGDEAARFRTLEALVDADPAGTLDKLESVRFAHRQYEFNLRLLIAAAMAAVDPEDAAAVAEAIADPGPRAGALIWMVDALPPGPRERALALLDRAAVHARATPDPAERLRWLGDVAERLHDLGEVEKAKAVFAEGLRIANQIPDKAEPRRAAFAGQLARVDVPAALAIAGDFRARPGALAYLAQRLIDKDPAEAERIWKGLIGSNLRLGVWEGLCWKMATVDPARARRFVDGLPGVELNPDLYVCLALGAWKRDEAEARRALDAGIRGFDRLLHDEPERARAAADLLPVAERIDPALVPEFFWRAVAALTPTENPRSVTPDAPNASASIERLAWYDRAVAAALFEPARERIERAEDRDLATWQREFLAWSSFDPRAAVERLEKVPVRADNAPNANAARLAVAASLGRPYEKRWRRSWNYWGTILGTRRNSY